MTDKTERGKPSWADSPIWACWLAMDSDGSWQWHENAPTWKQYDGVWYSRGQMMFAKQDVDPSQTLEARNAG